MFSDLTSFTWVRETHKNTISATWGIVILIFGWNIGNIGNASPITKKKLQYDDKSNFKKFMQEKNRFGNKTLKAISLC